MRALTYDHPDREPGEGEGVEAEHQVDVDDDPEDGHQGHPGHVEPGRARLREPEGRGCIIGTLLCAKRVVEGCVN